MSDNEAKHNVETLQAEQHASNTNHDDGRDAVSSSLRPGSNSLCCLLWAVICL